MSQHGKPSGLGRKDGLAAEPVSSPLSRPPGGQQAASEDADLIRYTAPIFAYVALTALEGYLPHGQGRGPGQASPVWYPLFYTAKVVVVALLAWRYRSTWKDFLPIPNLASLGLAAATGLLVWGIWIGLDGRYPPLPLVGGVRAGFNPAGMSPAARWAFITVRIAGLAVLVPVIEELFWRSFLMRWLIDPDIFKVAVGRVTPLAATVTSILFALAHPEWLAALVTGFLWAWLLWQTKSLSACAASHAIANFALGVYVIASGAWKFW